MRLLRIALSLISVGTLLSLSPVQASDVWPESACQESPYWLRFTEVEFCFSRGDIENLNYLNLSSPSLQLTFNSHAQMPGDLGMARLDEQKTTGGLHSQLGLSVEGMFSKLAAGELSSGADRNLVNAVMTISDDSAFRHYQRNSLHAFVIFRSSDMWDAIYLVDEASEGSIHLTGQFDLEEVEWILARIRGVPVE